MASADLLPAAVLKRKAVVYICQSTQAQVQTNLESRRRQYELVDVARQRGFRDVEVIDDDLGRWHHLLELCGLVEARVIDLDGVYDPAGRTTGCCSA
jgi:hypothetical protein